MIDDVASPDIELLAAEAFTYLYPLAMMDVTRAKLTDPNVKALSGAPNTFVHVRAFPTADFRDVVRPNFDTLYSSVWFDLTDGPVVVHIPDSAGRYFLLPMMDMWTDVFTVPGKRTTGTSEQHFVLTPPGWVGDLPDGLTEIKAPTVYVWSIGRTQTNGPADYDAVHSFQDEFRIEKLGGGGATQRRDISDLPTDVDLSVEPLRIVNSMPAVDFFAYAARLLQKHPAHLTDGSIVARIKRIGIVPGRDFDASQFDEGQLAALQAGVKTALASFTKSLPLLGRAENGWVLYTDSIGVYGSNYLMRAVTALVGLGANQPEDAIYPVNFYDSAGTPPTGERAYVIHFDPDDLPPVNAFWSITMYDAEGYQVANELNRFAIGDRDDLTYAPDGSLDIYVQHENPGSERESNWLPAPMGPLGITLRLYAPKPSVLAREWKCPPVVAV